MDMFANDCRLLSLSRQEEACTHSVSMVHDGILPIKVAWHLEAGTTSVFRWLSHYRQGGRGAFSCNRGGAISASGILRFIVTDRRRNSRLFCGFFDWLRGHLHSQS